ncbi:MAG: HAMP domain-containing methyl-accepting chemotaxis protein [Candidatus Omnitrophota bacterium]
MKQNYSLGIREKFMFFVIGIMFLLGIVLTSVSILQQKNILDKLEAALIAKGTFLSSSLASRSVLSIFLNDTKTLENLVAGIQKDRDISYLVIEDAKGNKLAGLAIPDIPVAISHKTIKSQGPTTEMFKIKGERFYEFSMPVFSKQNDGQDEMGILEIEEAAENNTEKIGSVRIGMSFKNIDLQSKLLIVRSLILMVLVVIICAIINYYFFTSIVTAPISALIEVASAAAGEGDLTRSVKEINSKDEIGLLLSAFNVMIESLHDIVSEARNSSIKINSMSQDLSSTAEEMNASTEEISSTIQEISKDIVKHAQRMRGTSSIVEKLNSSVKQVTQNAAEGANATQETTVLAKKGKDASTEAVERIKRINVVAKKMAGVVGKLGERSVEVVRIVEVITNIADQTNLLSLNAAIEAARAGEAGRGFAVVAEEVRKLAENSAKAAEQIAGLIRTIQNETIQAVESVQKASEEVEGGISIIEDVRSSLDSILKAAEHAANQVQQIATASDSQLGNTKDVNEAIAGVSVSAEKSISSAETASSAIEQMSASMQEMASNTQELSEMASILQKIVKKFKVKS